MPLAVEFQNSKILIIGVAYKKNINDDRESPAYKLIEILLKKYNCKVSYYDPYINTIKIKNSKKFKNKSIKLEEKKLKSFDFGILVTDHDSIDYQKVKKNIKIIFDTRNLELFHGNNVIKI